MRLFVSVDLDELAAEVAAVQAPLTDVDGLRLTDPSQAHVTLQFLGDTDESRLPTLREELAAAVAEADVGPFEATFGGLDVFPSLDYISVVWLGVRAGAGDAELARLHDAVEARTTALGFEPDDHQFTPHVTLARMEHAGGKAQVQDLVRERDPDAGSTTVSEVRLTRSHLDGDSPTYETVEAFPL